MWRWQDWSSGGLGGIDIWWERSYGRGSFCWPFFPTSSWLTVMLYDLACWFQIWVSIAGSGVCSLAWWMLETGCSSHGWDETCFEHMDWRLCLFWAGYIRGLLLHPDLVWEDFWRHGALKAQGLPQKLSESVSGKLFNPDHKPVCRASCINTFRLSWL